MCDSGMCPQIFVNRQVKTLCTYKCLVSKTSGLAVTNSALNYLI